MMRTMAMVAAVLAAGCSGGDAATTGDGGDFLGGDLARRDGGSQAAADLAAPAAVGYVTMVSNSGTSGGTAFKQAVVSAFFERIAPGAAAACTTTTSGSCIVTSCVVPHTDGG